MDARTIRVLINSRDKRLATEVGLDIAFPDRKDSKTEALKGEIMDLYRQYEEAVEAERDANEKDMV